MINADKAFAKNFLNIIDTDLSLTVITQRTQGFPNFQDIFHLLPIRTVDLWGIGAGTAAVRTHELVDLVLNAKHRYQDASAVLYPHTSVPLFGLDGFDPGLLRPTKAGRVYL
ncbi:hypothetical protein M8998_02270 [Sphingobacterium sp. lm-10]|uniref:hypothetical protein n=1 Tax=Sphingobacterium sp. lm-10 TaxID=2944904 RepID=UPI00202214A0|nr:hypothetical protein [Sphingobacterium sp. lm-10]MCL7986758.1 hypothetical protein [Sphingobacterium sp. lm-10]